MNKKFIWLIILFIIPPALLAQNAPVTTAGRVTDAVPGDPDVIVPIQVEDFAGIGQFTLTLKFDTTNIRYVSSTLNSTLPGMTVTYTPPSVNTQGKLVFTWTGTENVDLADGSSLSDLTFQYVSGTGLLSWSYTFGSICRYKSFIGGNLTTLYDTPKYQYYMDGGISNRTAPFITAPVLADPVPGPLPVNITASGFNSIKSFTLYLDYDATILDYQNSFEKNPAFDSNFIVGDNPGTGNNRFIVIQWFANNPVTLADGSVICALDFDYLAANCNPCLLNWNETGPTCEFTDENGDVLIDMPPENYYFDGIVASGQPVIWTGNESDEWDNILNWDECGTPDNLRDVVIPDVSPNAYPIINSPVYCKSITIQTGATLSVSSSGSITIGIIDF